MKAPEWHRNGVILEISTGSICNILIKKYGDCCFLISKSYLLDDFPAQRASDEIFVNEWGANKMASVMRRILLSALPSSMHMLTVRQL